MIRERAEKLFNGERSFCNSKLFRDLSFGSRPIYEKEDKGSHKMSKKIS